MADTTNRLAGTAAVTVDGVTTMVAGDFKYSPSTVKRETMAGQDGVQGYKETPVAGFIAWTNRDSGGTSVTDFNGYTNVTITATLANGKTIIGSNMWSVNIQEVSSEDAKFDVRFEGASVIEN